MPFGYVFIMHVYDSNGCNGFNVDGSSLGYLSYSGYGSFVRNSLGSWLIGVIK